MEKKQPELDFDAILEGKDQPVSKTPQQQTHVQSQ
jgi:hypothetical protein